MAIEDHWPFFALRVRTPRLELRTPDDEIGVQLGELAVRGVHDPATMPFSIPWTDAPADELPRNALQHYWLNRAQLAPRVVAPVPRRPRRRRGGGRRRAGGRGVPPPAHVRDRARGWGRPSRAGASASSSARRACTSASPASAPRWPPRRPGTTTPPRSASPPSSPTSPTARTSCSGGSVPDRMLRFRMPRAAWETVRRDDIDDRGPRPLPAHPRPLTHRIGGSR